MLLKKDYSKRKPTTTKKRNRFINIKNKTVDYQKGRGWRRMK